MDKTSERAPGVAHSDAAGARATESPLLENDDSWQARDKRMHLKLAGLVALLVFVYLIPDIFYSVLSGRAAVIWYLFFGGTDVEDVRGEGLRVKWPWDKVYIYDTRLQHETTTLTALTSDGLPIEVEVSIRFRLHKEAVGALHKHVGPNYVEKLILPELGSNVREPISRYSPAQLYAQRRADIEKEIRERLETGLLLAYEAGWNVERAIFVEDLLIRNLDLPPKVKAAIDDKLAQEQRMLEYDFRLKKEEKERQRKVIEAKGIREFQDIVTEGISERYLKWKGIDATLELARSPNSKIVVIGAGEDGLPIILGGLDAPANSLQSTPPPTVPPP